MSENKKFVAIKVKKELYECLVEMKKIIIQQGLNTFPKEFLIFLKEKDFNIKRMSFGDIISLANNAILYLFKENKE